MRPGGSGRSGCRLRGHALNHDLTSSSNGAADGQAFGPFPVLHQIGMGALGPVFRAQGTAGGELVAIKAFKLDVSPELAPSIADELRALVGRAPTVDGLVPLLDAALERETPWLAMEHLAYPTLDTRLREGGLLPLDEATALVRALAEAVDTAHAHGLRHGSLHPRDVFLRPDGTVLISGFGVAAALGVAGLRPPRRRPFTAPETLAQKPVDAPADRYALGVMAYEIVSGRRLLGASDDLVAGLAARAATSDVGRAAIALAAMLADRPDHRPSSSAAFAQALTAALDAPPPASATDAPTVPVSAPAHPLVAVIAPIEARPPRPSDDAPPAEALAEFARQGTFWEPPRRPVADADPATLATVVSPASRTPAEPPTTPIAGRDRVESRAGRERAEGPRPVPRVREPQPEPASEIAADPPLRIEPPAPAVPDDSRLFSTFGDVPDRTPTADQAEAQTHTPPFVVLALTLGLGLAIGAAGGYLVGQRSGERAAQRALGGTTTADFPPDAPASSAVTPGTDRPAASASPAPATEPVSPPPAPVPDTGKPAAAPPAPEAEARPRPAAVGHLVIRSTPARAGVMIDGSWRGRTPLTVRGLTVGTHAVRVVEDGYISETRRVVVDARPAGTTVSFQLARVRGADRTTSAAPRPGATTGRLLLESRPSGAAVLIDGRVVGTTPLVLSDLEPGPRQVRIELPGHRPWTTTATVVAGQRVRVAASLEESTER
jgi:eukaryotic-like serine/threonine-protein kinase